MKLINTYLNFNIKSTMKFYYYKNILLIYLMSITIIIYFPFLNNSSLNLILEDKYQLSKKYALYDTLT